MQSDDYDEAEKLLGYTPVPGFMVKITQVPNRLGNGIAQYVNDC